MNLSSRALALLVSSFTALSMAACGGSVEGEGGGGSGGSSGTTTSTTSTTASTTAESCAGFCDYAVGCIDPAECVLVDPSGAKAACLANCAAGYAALTAAETAAVAGCIDCLVAVTPPGVCGFDSEEGAACKTKCDSNEVEAAGEKWMDLAAPSGSVDPTATCTNGKNPFGSSACSAAGGGGSCDIECCNGDCTGAPTVGATCTPEFGAATCTCTAGKNKGKTYPTTDACSSDEVWNQCNL